MPVKRDFSYVYLVMPGLTGHLLYNIRVYNYVTALLSTKNVDG